MDPSRRASSRASPRWARRWPICLVSPTWRWISGGDWPQFDKQVASRLPARADRARLWLMPTTGTKLYTHSVHGWQPVYAELFEEGQKRDIL